MDNIEEIFPIVDEAGNVIGSATRGECHSGSKLLHPVVHLHVFNSKGEIYDMPAHAKSTLSGVKFGSPKIKEELTETHYVR